MAADRRGRRRRAGAPRQRPASTASARLGDRGARAASAMRMRSASGDLVAAPLRDHDAQLGLEVEGLEARVQSSRWCAMSVRFSSVELAVEVGVELVRALPRSCSRACSWCSAMAQSSCAVVPAWAGSAVDGLGGLGIVRPRPVGEPPLDGELVQLLLQRLSSPVQPAHHGADRDVEDLGDLLVGEALDVGEQHGHAEAARAAPRGPPSPRRR